MKKLLWKEFDRSPDGRRKLYRIEIGFKMEDLWVGVYWKISSARPFRGKFLNIYICPVPCLVMRLELGNAG